MEAEIIDLCDSDDDKSNIDLVPILPSAPARCTTNNGEKSFLNASAGVPEAERLIAECSICDGVFNSTAAFVSHMQSYHRIGSLFECTSCHQIFISQAGLKYHINTVHPLPQPSLPRSTCLSCDICGDKFKFQEALDAHKDVHTLEKKFSISAENLDNETASKKYTCSICLKKFFVEKALLSHRKKKHIILRKGRPKSAPLTSNVIKKACPKGGNFICDVCNKVFPFNKNLLSHRRWHFRRDPSLIDKNLTNQSLNGNLMSPVIRTKQTSMSKQNCESDQTCQSEQTSESAKLKEFRCFSCERVFLSKRGLGRHTSWHLKRARRLDMSRKRIETRGSKKRVTKEGSTKKLKISIQLFANNKAKIKNPINNDHKETQLIESEDDSSVPDFPNKSANAYKAFECNLCNEKFLFCYNYRQHMETHRKKKSLCCHICGEFFAFKCSLQTHEYIHHSSEEVSFCKLCHRPYTDKYSLEVHYRSCYQMSLKVKESVYEKEEKRIYLNSTTTQPINSTTANPMPLNQFLSSSTDTIPSKFMEPLKSTKSTHNPMPNLMPLNQSLCSSAEMIPSKFKEPLKSTNSTHSEIQPHAWYPLSLFEKGYYYCNICEKKYSTEIRLLHHVLLMHPSENYPFDPLPYSQQAQDSPDLSNEGNFVNSFSSYAPPPDESSGSSQQDFDPLSLDPLNEPFQHQATCGNEGNLFQNLITSNPMPLNLSVSCDQREVMKAFSEYLLTVDKVSHNPTSLNNNNSDLSLHSNQEHRNY